MKSRIMLILNLPHHLDSHDFLGRGLGKQRRIGFNGFNPTGRYATKIMRELTRRSFSEAYITFNHPQS